MRITQKYCWDKIYNYLDDSVYIAMQHVLEEYITDL